MADVNFPGPTILVVGLFEVSGAAFTPAALCTVEKLEFCCKLVLSRTSSLVLLVLTLQRRDEAELVF